MTDATPGSTLAQRYEAVRLNIARAARLAGRDPDSVTLVVASKTQPIDILEELLSLGHRVFGENRVQEAQAKWPSLKERYPDLVLHLIGPLQTNKARDACQIFDVIETIDRERLARAVAAEQLKLGRNLEYLIEVNIGREAQKAGVMPEEAAGLVDLCRKELRLKIAGLMCIPPAERQASPYFAMLSRLGDDFELAVKSMGMTADYPLAIAMGATHVRVGTAIFGKRQ